MENKKLQDSGLEIDVISASGPVKQKKWPLFPHSSDSSNHPWIKSKWIILKCATLSMEKLIPNHIQIIPNSHGPFFSSRIPMFRTSQINRQQFPQIFAPPILSNKWSGCSIYLTPEKKKNVTQLPGYHRSCHRSWEILFSRFLCWADSVGEFDLKFLSFSAPKKNLKHP